MYFGTRQNVEFKKQAVPFLKMLECVSGFENFTKIIWIQDI